MPDIGKYRLNGAHPSSVEEPSANRIEIFDHLLCVTLLLIPDTLLQFRHLSGLRVGISDEARPQITGEAVFLLTNVLTATVAFRSGLEISTLGLHGFTGRTYKFPCSLIKMKIIRTEVFTGP
jgi:hypothetical protein